MQSGLGSNEIIKDINEKLATRKLTTRPILGKLLALIGCLCLASLDVVFKVC